MAASDPPWLAAQVCTWPEPWQTWYGGEYPSRPADSPLAMSGWRCPGCARCMSPSVRECPHCQPRAGEPVPDWGNAGITPGARTGAGSVVPAGASCSLGPAAPMGEWDDEDGQ